MPTAAHKTAHSDVAVFLTNALEATSKTQQEIANEAGFPRSNVLSMMKMGMTKLPIVRIPAIADALGVDKVELFRLAMSEYSPELLEVCDQMYDLDRLNRGERELLKRLRLHTKGKSFRLNASANDTIDELAKHL